MFSFVFDPDIEARLQHEGKSDQDKLRRESHPFHILGVLCCYIKTLLQVLEMKLVPAA